MPYFQGSIEWSLRSSPQRPSTILCGRFNWATARRGALFLHQIYPLLKAANPATERKMHYWSLHDLAQAQFHTVQVKEHFHTAAISWDPQAHSQPEKFCRTIQTLEAKTPKCSLSGCEATDTWDSIKVFIFGKKNAVVGWLTRTATCSQELIITQKSFLCRFTLI